MTVNTKNYLFSDTDINLLTVEINGVLKKILEISQDIIEDEKVKEYSAVNQDLNEDKIENILFHLRILMDRVYGYYYKLETNIAISTGRLGFEEAMKDHDKKIEKIEKMMESVDMIPDVEKRISCILSARNLLQVKLSGVGVDLLQREKIIRDFWEKEVLLVWADAELIKEFPLFFHFLNKKLLEHKH